MAPSPYRGRRRDDWKSTSPVTAKVKWLWDIAMHLGYDPRTVIAVRINRNEAVVTFTERDGMPRSVRHEVER